MRINFKIVQTASLHIHVAMMDVSLISNSQRLRLIQMLLVQETLLAVMAAGMCTGQQTMVTASIACCMAAIAVNTMGNNPITQEELKGYISNLAV